MSPGTLNSIARSSQFAESATACVLLDSNFRVLGVNDRYLATADRTREQLQNVNIFDSFPDNPQDSFAAGMLTLSGSFDHVLHHDQPQALPTQRYDVITDGGRGSYVTRFWNTVNSPVHDPRGKPVGVLHQVHEVVVPSSPHEFAAPGGVGQLEAENAALRRALASRSVIEQAKGMLMSERRCTADEAFEILVDLSQQWNVKLRDIADGLVSSIRT